MAHSSEVTSGMLFVWKVAQLPVEGTNLKSPVFSFLDAEWFLTIHSLNAKYSVYLQKTTEWGNCRPFEVTVGIEEGSITSSSPRCQTVKVNNGHNTTWVIREFKLRKETSAFDLLRRNFTVVCMLHSVSPSRSITDDLEGLSFDLGNLLEKGTMPDVKLKCGDVIVPAHRLVLTARSEVFSAMFRNDMTVSRSGVVDMSDMEIEVLGLLLKYVYTGKLPEESPVRLRRLYRAGNKYAIPGLKKACSDRLTGGLTEENCLAYLILADAYCDSPFKDAVVSFIVNNQRVMFKRRDWFHFQEQQPKLTIEVLNRCLVK